MANYGIKISKPGFDVKTASIKELVLFSQAESPKVFHKGWETTNDFTHNLGYKPLCLAFDSDSVSAPTFFSLFFPESTITKILFGASPSDPVYVVVFHEGIA